MRIAIDARNYFFRAGLGRYVRGVVNGLATHHPENKYIIFISNHKTIEDFPLNEKNIDVKISSADVNNPEHEWDILTGELNSCEPDIVYLPVSTLTDQCNAPTVTTIHDLTHIHVPEHHTGHSVEYMKKFLSQIFSRRGRIVTVSKFVRDDVLQYAKENNLPADSNLVTAIYPGVEDAFFQKLDENDLAPTLGRYGLQKNKYLLFVGSIEPRKNLSAFLKAYEISGVDIPLVIAGVMRWMPEEFIATIEREEIRDKVKLLGFVPDSDLPALYQGSMGVAYPSLSEGFGFPIAEAYVSGVPVITSNNTSMKEIGKAAALTDPHDIDKMAMDLEAFVKDENQRNEFAKQGAIEALSYRWSICADLINREFEKAVDAN